MILSPIRRPTWMLRALIRFRTQKASRCTTTHKCEPYLMCHRCQRSGTSTLDMTNNLGILYKEQDKTEKAEVMNV